MTLYVAYCVDCQAESTAVDSRDVARHYADAHEANEGHNCEVTPAQNRDAADAA